MGADDHGDHCDGYAKEHSRHAPERSPKTEGKENHERAEVQRVSHKTGF